MDTIIIDGKAVAAKIRNEIKQGVDLYVRSTGKTPCLAVVLVGDDPASRIYVNNKKKACSDAGIRSLEFALPKETSEAEVLDLIQRLNEDTNVNGILVQMPIPKHISGKRIIRAIDPKKDVDCFHPYNVGLLAAGDNRFEPCTPSGIMELLKSAGVDPEGKNAVVIGRSHIVGKPMAVLLTHANATVTLAHSYTKNLKEICRNADIIVVAVGKAKFLTADYLKQGVCVIDVGMDRDENGKLCGDADFEAIKDICSAITPVPGGVGPMTVTILLRNTLTAARLQ